MIWLMFNPTSAALTFRYSSNDDRVSYILHRAQFLQYVRSMEAIFHIFADKLLGERRRPGPQDDCTERGNRLQGRTTRSSANVGQRPIRGSTMRSPVHSNDGGLQRLAFRKAEKQERFCEQRQPTTDCRVCYLCHRPRRSESECLATMDKIGLHTLSR